MLLLRLSWWHADGMLMACRSRFYSTDAYLMTCRGSGPCTAMPPQRICCRASWMPISAQLHSLWYTLMPPHCFPAAHDVLHLSDVFKCLVCSMPIGLLACFRLHRERGGSVRFAHMCRRPWGGLRNMLQLV